MEKQWENKVQGLQAEITDHKHHLDQFKQQRTSLEREITKLKDELGDMEKMHFASSSLEATHRTPHNTEPKACRGCSLSQTECFHTSRGCRRPTALKGLGGFRDLLV